ncbi:putative oxygenase MesX [Rhodococcus pyridinivorans]|uniref:putative oxygenase MesX n=1 Tax=Rhodococcus pyridinivorans TaxID=103816 RepID=UPI00110D2F9B|nr:putative oxygenase MesX [Rhodococcus pyridinivorans]
MTNDCVFSIDTTRFDEDYTPATDSRSTTNFANLARGEGRRQNLRNALTMMNTRVNELVHWDNPRGDRYALELDIVSVDLHLASAEDDATFPVIEMLDVDIVDTTTGGRTEGIVGNNFSSYIRDYDFSVRLPGNTGIPSDFGDLHGQVFQRFLESDEYRERFSQPPVICISVSTSRTYRRLTNYHPILGVEYVADGQSLTDRYFGKMRLRVRYFMPQGAAAPLAFYHRGDLLNDYSFLALAGTIATMETFQKIYRPEIYNANTAASEVYRPSLDNGNYSFPQVSYDRVERAQLATTQGKFTEVNLMKPYGAVLEQWATKQYA